MNGKSDPQTIQGTFIDEAISSGLVRRAFDDVGSKTSVVAPVGLNP